MRLYTLLGILTTLLIAQTPAVAQPLRTGFVVYPPFGERDGTGICPEIWSEIARNAGLDYTLQPRTNIQSTLEAVAAVTSIWPLGRTLRGPPHRNRWPR